MNAYKSWQGPIDCVLPPDGTEPEGKRWCLCAGGLVAVPETEAQAGRLFNIVTKNGKRA